MDENGFWQVIDESRAGNEKDPEAQAEALKRLLTGRPADELVAFDGIYREHLRRAFRWDLWGAGYLMHGGMGDDSFEYFLDWLIGRGRDVFERVLADPDALADVADPDDDISNEGLRYAVDEAHEATHGSELEIGPGVPDEPAGEEWDEDDLEALFPRIAAKVGAA